MSLVRYAGLRAVAVALLVGLSGRPVPAAPTAPEAILAAVTGRVTVTPSRGGPPEPAMFGRALARGDHIVVNANAHATVVLGDGSILDLAGKSALTVGGRVSQRVGARVGMLSREIFSDVSRFVIGGSRREGLVALPPLRGRDVGPMLLRPRRTSLLERRPRLFWLPVAGATAYRVAVAGESGELWHREVRDTTVAYPANAAPLAPGADISWEVRALGANGEIRRERSLVHVLGAAEAARARRALQRIRSATGGDSTAAARYLAGSYLYVNQLYAEAAAEFEALRDLAPTSPAPLEAIGEVDRAVGLPELAADEDRRAHELGRRP